MKSKVTVIKDETFINTRIKVI
jgi:predicted ester cyclase